MKRLLVGVIFLIISLGAKDLVIKRDGNKAYFSFEKKDRFYIVENRKFDDNVKIIIVYEDSRLKEDIEKKYNLLNGKDKYGMYYIYEQNSDDVIKLFSKLSGEKNIHNVYPNWTTRVKKF